MHRPLGEQREDRRPHIATPAATAAAMAAALTARSEAGTEWAAAKPDAAGAGLVFEVAPHLAEGFPLGPVHGAAAVGVDRAEAKPFMLWAVMWALVWVSHVCLFSRFWSKALDAPPTR